LHIKKTIHPRNHEHLMSFFEFVQDFFNARPSLRWSPKTSDPWTFCCDTQPPIYINGIDRPIGSFLGTGHLSTTRKRKMHPDDLLLMVIIELVEWLDSHSTVPSELRVLRRRTEEASHRIMTRSARFLRCGEAVHYLLAFRRAEINGNRSEHSGNSRESEKLYRRTAPLL
jgi:hypothetical protein